LHFRGGGAGGAGGNDNSIGQRSDSASASSAESSSSSPIAAETQLEAETRLGVPPLGTWGPAPADAVKGYYDPKQAGDEGGERVPLGGVTSVFPGWLTALELAEWMLQRRRERLGGRAALHLKSGLRLGKTDARNNDASSAGDLDDTSAPEAGMLQYDRWFRYGKAVGLKGRRGLRRSPTQNSNETAVSHALSGLDSGSYGGPRLDTRDGITAL